MRTLRARISGPNVARTINPEKTIGALELLALAGATIGEVREHGGMPRPAVLGAIYLFYGLLGIVATISSEAGRIAAAIGGVVTLAALVTGAAGRNLIGLLKWFTSVLPGAQTTSGPGGTGSQPGAGGPI